jgi:drug/metabolite transporter (DMT)-like permease
MIYLLLVSIIWAFSPSLIKGRLTGLDPKAVSVIRLALALIVFLPFFRPSVIPRPIALRLVAIGTVQFGLMYLGYLHAFTFLPAYAIGLFTLTTPLYVVLIEAIITRRWQTRHVIAAALAILGAAVLFDASAGAPSGWLYGCVLVQFSNLCFAAGQLAWRRTRVTLPANIPDTTLFALPYAGALTLTGIVSAFTTDWTAIQPAPTQVVTLLYLGVIASGLSFFLWNLGATRVATGTLAVLNNLKVPLTVAVALLFFGEQTNLPRLALSFACFTLALFIGGRETA